MSINFIRVKVTSLCSNNEEAKEGLLQIAGHLNKGRFSVARSAISVFGKLLKEASLSSSHACSFLLVMQGRFQLATQAFKEESNILIKKIKIVAYGIFFVSLGLLFPVKVYAPFPSTKPSTHDSVSPSRSPNPPNPPAQRSSIRAVHDSVSPSRSPNPPNPPAQRSSIGAAVAIGLQKEHILALYASLPVFLKEHVLALYASLPVFLSVDQHPVVFRAHAMVAKVAKALPRQHWLGVEFVQGREKQIFWMDFSHPDLQSSLRNLNQFIIPDLSARLNQFQLQRDKALQIHSSLALIGPHISEPSASEISNSTNHHDVRDLEYSQAVEYDKEISEEQVSNPLEEEVSDFVLVKRNEKDSVESFFDDYNSLCIKRGFPSGYCLGDVRSLIAKGQRLCQKIREGTAQKISLEERRSWMAPFVWALMYHAHKKRQSFIQGMFDFSDPGHKATAFFAPVATPRLSSHYKNKRMDSFGMDIVQDYKNGLPANHQTVLFGRLRTQVGRERSYLKPENWGLESWYQWGGHAVDYLATRVHNPEHEEDRKEHCPEEVKEAFKSLCSQLMNGAHPLKEIDGITEMVRFLMDYLEHYPINEGIVVVQEFISFLEEKYPDIADMGRKGNEASLGDSFIFGGESLELKPPTEEQIAFSLFKAFLTLKTAKNGEEVQSALASIRTLNEDIRWKSHPTMIEGNIAVYEQKGASKKEAILHQVGLDLARSQGQEVFKVNGVRFEGTAQDLFNRLSSYYLGNENRTLNTMTLMQQGVKEAMMSEMIRCLASPIPGLQIINYAAPQEDLAEVDVKTLPFGITIDVWQKYALKATDIEKSSIFRIALYAIVKGFTRIELPNEGEAKALIRWSVDRIVELF